MKYLGFILSLILLYVLSCSEEYERNSKSKEDWMSVWIGDQKIGWVYTLENPEEKGYRITERTKLKLSVMGQIKSIETLTQSQTSKDHGIRSFLFELLSEEHTYRVEGRKSGTELKVEVLTGGEKRTESVNVPDHAYLPLSIGRVAILRGMKVGDVIRLPVYDPSLLTLLDATITAEGIEELKLPDFEGKAMKLNVEMWNLNLTLWVDKAGWVVKELAPMGMEMMRTTRETAMKLEPSETLLEILTHYSISSVVRISNPREVELMVVELRGLDELPDIEDERQSIISEDPLKLRIVAQPQIRGEWRTEDLDCTVLIQCDNELIREKARSIVEGARSDSRKVEGLIQWMYENIRKSPTVSFPSALDVLKSGEGDCNEHAVLFAALARSLGIPTRICVGVVYQNGSFYYHAWNKVWIGSWIACDATFGQLLADATHIKLLEGDLSEHLKIANIIGKLQINVIEQSRTVD